ncbi:MAG: Gfo/Idh/MocA family oxidoreductase [Bryobacterales bacterium]
MLSLKEQDNVEIIGVCDLYKPRLEAAAELTGGKPYHDYRKLLEQKGLDYVVVSVPEHWHSKITLDALDQGLHVYCEKPSRIRSRKASWCARK